MKSLLLSVLLLSILVGAGCSGMTPLPSDGPPSGGVVRSSKERVMSPQVADADLEELVDGNNAFAFELYQAISGGEDNLLCSPHSITLALAMTYAGARGETEQQMAQALHYTLPQDRLHPAFNSLDLKLASRAEGMRDEEGGFKLNIANSIWGQAGYSFLPEFLDLLAENYDAGLRVLDFVQEPENSRITINDWVSEETEGKILDLLASGSITPATRLVLTNAIYFNAAWMHPFDDDLTRDDKFYLLDGGQVAVPMMEETERFGYAEGDGYQAIELPYEGHSMSMVILLPDTGKFEEFAAALESESVASDLMPLARAEVHLTMPKFSFESEFSLKEALIEMGMPSAFGAADLSAMDGTSDLFIDGVYHKAFINVDEEGTEAAAATAVVVALTAIEPTPPIEFRVDRPFMFMIRDIETGAILFLGHVVDPR